MPVSVVLVLKRAYSELMMFKLSQFQILQTGWTAPLSIRSYSTDVVIPERKSKLSFMRTWTEGLEGSVKLNLELRTPVYQVLNLVPVNFDIIFPFHYCCSSSIGYRGDKSHHSNLRGVGGACMILCYGHSGDEDRAYCLSYFSFPNSCKYLISLYRKSFAFRWVGIQLSIRSFVKLNYIT